MRALVGKQLAGRYASVGCLRVSGCLVSGMLVVKVRRFVWLTAQPQVGGEGGGGSRFTSDISL